MKNIFQTTANSIERSAKQEFLLYGLKQGEPSYMETMLAENLYTEAQIEDIKRQAQKDGYITFRVAKFNLSKPDFTKTIQL